MQRLSVAGYPRIGAQRELKNWVEGYFKGKILEQELQENSLRLKKRHWLEQKQSGIDFIPSNDFSFYDTFLDTAYLLNCIPDKYKALRLCSLETYFAMAKGYQQNNMDVTALPMKKWFNTNYHYIVPLLDGTTQLKLNGSKPFDEYREALELGIKTKPVITGLLTFLKLSKISDGEKHLQRLLDSALKAYEDMLLKFNELKVEYIQIDEPVLVTDLSDKDIEYFKAIYKRLLGKKGGVKVLLHTCFGDIRDIYNEVMSLGFDGVGLDFAEGPKNLELIEKNGFPDNVLLVAGIVNGKNIWINNYEKTLNTLDTAAKQVKRSNIVLGTSCSLLHVPYTTENELQMEGKYKKHLAFAHQKLKELEEISSLWNSADFKLEDRFIKNSFAIKEKLESMEFFYEDVREDAASLIDSDFIRQPAFEERIKKQKENLRLPLLPSTTIGSFPQTSELRALRSRLKKGQLSKEQYEESIKEKIAEVVALQEEIGLDVIVHGEFERNDMVEYFGENLSGFLFTANGWVQSYGTRCVKPPVIFGDVKRLKPITVEYVTYAQSLTSKPVKGMLTGPVTILNWSFPREDLSLAEVAYQIAIAIKGEVRDLEAKGIKIIQIDEAALREKLPLRKADWRSGYLCWAIKAFRLVHSHVRPGTQIHTHMCYSEFDDIIKEIDDMDADVITFEAARSDLLILDVLKKNNFRTEVGPGVYDIHSPRVPSKQEIIKILDGMSKRLDKSKLWVNPDCGLKTRGMEETILSLKNLVEAAREFRKSL